MASILGLNFFLLGKSHDTNNIIAVHIQPTSNIGFLEEFNYDCTQRYKSNYILYSPDKYHIYIDNYNANHHIFNLIKNDLYNAEDIQNLQTKEYFIPLYFDGK